MMIPKSSKLNLFSLTMIVIGFVIGMGIFRTAALTYAEIGSRYPVTGGYYKVFAKAYHPSIAFAINCIILVSNAASVAGVALIGSGYLLKLFPGTYTDIDKALVSSAAIIVFFLINLKGLKTSSTAQNILMMIKITMVVVLISALFFPDKYAVNDAAKAAVTDHAFTWIEWVKSLGISLIAVSFTYGGYQQTINLGNDVENPSKNIPKGIFIGIVLIIGLYMLVNLSYFNVVGFNQMKGEREIAYVVIDRIFGSGGASAFSALLFLGVLAYVNGSLLSNPRVMFAMGEDGSFPKLFAKHNEKTNVVSFSLTVFSALCVIILYFSQEFEKILTFTIFLDSFGMILSAATIFWFRKKTKHLDGTGIYKMKLFPLMPVIFILAYLFVACSITIADPKAALTGIIVLAAFILLYFILHKAKRKINSLEN